MDNAAFTRAKRFLNYVPIAKWLSILCGVATAILFVGLLLVLALFADLMVNHGKIPAEGSNQGWLITSLERGNDWLFAEDNETILEELFYFGPGHRPGPAGAVVPG